MRFWLERGVDGLRLDAINFCFHDTQLRDNPPRPKALRNGARLQRRRIPTASNGTTTTTRSRRCCRFLEEHARDCWIEYPDVVALGEISSDDSHRDGGRIHAAGPAAHGATASSC